jgi:nitrate/TMAO reductase-like tetraheme cytochrome c subunit
MKRWYKKILFLIIASSPVVAAAQDLDAHSPHQNDPISKQQRSAEKKKEGRKVNAEKAEKKFQKHNLDMQDKEVRKRIKKNKKKADKWNKRNH